MAKPNVLLSRAGPRNQRVDLRVGTSTTVSLITTHHVAAGTSREFPDDRPRQSIAQRGDGIGHVTLGALGSREVCNLRVGKAFLIEWSFFWSRHV